MAKLADNKPSKRYPVSPIRDAWLEINLNALEYNLSVIRKRLPQATEIMAILKADAYGCGVSALLPTFKGCGVSWLGVATVDEAMAIAQARDSAFRADGFQILILGPTPHWAMAEAIDCGFSLTVFTPEHLEHLETLLQESPQRKARLHLKVDTGMHRIGVNWQVAAEFYEKAMIMAQAYPTQVVVEGLFSHLACADIEDINIQQEQRFLMVLAQIQAMGLPLPQWVHLNSSARVLNQDDGGVSMPQTMVRVGLALYGYGHTDLQPVMGLKARITHLHTAEPGEGISYGLTHRILDSPTTVATLPLGYADGIFRSLSGKIQAHAGSQRFAQIGRITMDQLMLDVSAATTLEIGDTVTLLDSGPDAKLGANPLTLSEWAQAAKTIEYELMCALRTRLPKVYIR